ncbi:MAG: hypothetical protein IPP47_17450 [Bryobacterales bacterium]|nr:hypothetical protein [Bryobacterales bacterium]
MMLAEGFFRMPKLRPEYRDLLPVWFELPTSFFVKLKRLTDRSGSSSTEVLKKALRLFEESLEPKTTEIGESADRSPASLSSLRWAKMSSEERSEFARKMSLRRWGRKKNETELDANQR